MASSYMKLEARITAFRVITHPLYRARRTWMSSGWRSLNALDSLIRHTSARWSAAFPVRRFFQRGITMIMTPPAFDRASRSICHASHSRVLFRSRLRIDLVLARDDRFDHARDPRLELAQENVQRDSTSIGSVRKSNESNQSINQKEDASIDCVACIDKLQIARCCREYWLHNEIIT